MTVNTHKIRKKLAAKKRKHGHGATSTAGGGAAAAAAALHERSRDAQRLRAAGLRDDRLARRATERAKTYQPICTPETFLLFPFVFLLSFSISGFFLLSFTFFYIFAYKFTLFSG